MQIRAVQPPLVELTDELVLRHQRGVWRYLRFLGAAPALADDLTQEAFLALGRAPVEDRGASAVAAWLRVTAGNLYRAQGRAPGGELRLVDAAELERGWVLRAGDDGGEAWLAALDACLETLAPRQRCALELRYRAGRGASRDELAAALELSAEGVKTLLRRAKARLRACVERRLAL